MNSPSTGRETENSHQTGRNPYSAVYAPMQTQGQPCKVVDHALPPRLELCSHLDSLFLGLLANSLLSLSNVFLCTRLALLSFSSSSNLALPRQPDKFKKYMHQPRPDTPKGPLGQTAPSLDGALAENPLGGQEGYIFKQLEEHAGKHLPVRNGSQHGICRW